MSDNFERRKIERQGFCRGCDKVLSKGDEIIYTYSFRNRGQSIPICIPCGEQIAKLVK